MQNNYQIFRQFSHLGQATELRNILEANAIITQLDDNTPPVDVTFAGNTLQNKFEVLIRQSDFEKTEQILEKNAENIIDQIDKDYYLFQFTDDELYNILLKSDEWNEFDYTLAQKLLIQRGQLSEDN
ncbi:hypothetical protein [Winogradskyella sp. PG-2]|uniref:hypothetical protein n=1 Tax=Winogradskyella sp. PG-2 TaxID=754409 RepID=UPI0004588AD2|nr:hypothetical protein [Winogradskyella sp. PG-2]BAO74255.1 hypothetical protein WPG_0025 [Winogradskyella sp. PG-2]